MMSDGALDVLSDGEGDCVADIVAGLDTRNPQVIASAIIKEALERTENKAKDDMTVLVINVWKK